MAKPPGWHAITPRIVARDAGGLVKFLGHVLGAAGRFEPSAPCILTIGDSRIMVSEAGERPPAGAFLYVYVDDPDAVHRRAIEAGARSIEEPLDTPYGDRRGMFEDRWGNTWQVASYEGVPDGT